MGADEGSKFDALTLGGRYHRIDRLAKSPDSAVLVDALWPAEGRDMVSIADPFPLETVPDRMSADQNKDDEKEPNAFPLSSAEFTLETVLEGIGEGFLALGSDWQFVAFNAAAEQMFGLARSSVLGRTLWDVSPKIIGSEFERRYRDVMTTRAPQHFEAYSPYLGDRYHEVRAFPLGDGIGIAFRDATERHSNARALREREAELTRVQLIGKIGGLEVDLRQGFHNRRSPEYLRLHGLPPDATNETHEAWVNRIHPEDREQVEGHFKAIVAGGARDYSAEYRIVRPSDGEVRWISATAEIERDSEGRPIRLVGAHLDVTDRKRAELALKESEVRFRMIADSAPVPIWVTNPDGTRGFVNVAYCQFLGLPLESALTFDWRKALHPDDIERILIEQRRGESSGEAFLLEARYRRADGEWCWLRSESQPRRGPEGERMGFIGVAHDVTAAKHAEIELRAMNESLENRVRERTLALQAAEENLRQAQKMEAVGQLTGGIAHDFNNLLQGITGSLDLIKRRISVGRTADLDRFIAGATESANRAAALTHRLLAFSRRQPLDPKPVMMNRLVSSMEDLLRRTMGEQIEIELILAADLWLTLCDANQLENAVLNLAINARDAMPDGGRLLVATRNVHPDDQGIAIAREMLAGEYVCMSVSDTGVGMTKEVVDRAFDPFFTTKPLGQGTGLGLSMIYGFARQSDGFATIRSTPGTGTTVELYLPRHIGDAREEHEPRDRLTDLEMQRGETVLVVEDDPVVRGLIVEVLRDLGCRPIEAADGSAALTIMKGIARIDLLVTDIGLPAVNGRQVADAARLKWPGLKVLFMTGYAERTAANRFIPLGSEMITKPFAMDAFATRVSSILTGNPRPS